MADNEAPTPEDEVVEADDTESPGGKKARAADRVVMKEIRRARRLFRDNETAAEATFVIQAANVLALVDLAAAIRESNAGADDDA